MEILTWNIQSGLGRDGRYDLARIAAEAARADVICLQEVDRNWRRTGMADQPAELMALLPDRYAAYGAGLDVDASRQINGRVENRRRQLGNMTLSRWPILSSRAIVLPKIDTGPEFNAWCPALETVIDAPGGALRILNVHLSHARPEERLLQIESLRRLICEASAEGGAWNGADADYDLWQCGDPLPPMPEPVILVGDFNAEPDSAEIARLTAAPEEGHGFLDAWAVAAAPGDTGTTFFRDDHQGAHWDMRIDYVLLPPALAGHLVKLRTDTDCRASDHQPVWATLDWD